MHIMQLRQRSPRRRGGPNLRALCLATCIAGAAGCDGARDDDVRESAEPTVGQAAQGEQERDAPDLASSARADIALGTFRPADAPEADVAPAEGRLPGAGDRAIYVPATTLFPGQARLDPGIENPYEGDPEAVAAGERHFEAFNCAGCHAPLGGGGMGPPLSDDQWIHGSEPAQIYLSIMHGRSDGMPAWSSMLPARTVWEMVAYVQSLSEIDDYAARKGFESNADRFAGVDWDPQQVNATQDEGRPDDGAETEAPETPDEDGAQR